MQVAALASKHLHDNVLSSGLLDASNFPVSYCCLSARGTTAAMMLTKLYANASHSIFHPFLQDDQLPTSIQPQSIDIKTMRKAIATGFSVTDQQALKQAQQGHWVDGAVCVAVWIIQDTVFVANVGLMN